MKSRKANDGVTVVHGTSDNALGSEIRNENGSLEREKLLAEVEKLREEIRVLAENRRWPWLLRTAVPALIVSLGSGLGGYLFGDSLQSRTNSQVRTEVLKTYFSVENKNVGKRKQILAFVGSNLTSDNPELLAWVKRESVVVDETMARLDREISELKEQIERARAEKYAAESNPKNNPDSPLEHLLMEHLQKSEVKLQRRMDEKDPYTP